MGEPTPELGKMLMSGSLFPPDGVPGCSFTVHAVEGVSDAVYARIVSPSSDEVVDYIQCPLDEVGRWLTDRIDW